MKLKRQNPTRVEDQRPGSPTEIRDKLIGVMAAGFNTDWISDLAAPKATKIVVPSFKGPGYTLDLPLKKGAKVGMP